MKERQYGNSQLNSRLFVSSVLLLAAGTIGRFYADRYTHIDADDFLRDSAWMPLSALLFLGGLFLLMATAVLYVRDYLRRR